MTRNILSVAFVIIAIGMFAMITRPTYDDVQQQQAQMAQYDAALQKAAQLEQIKQTLLSRYNSFNQSDLSRLQVMVPDHVDNIGLILDLANLAGRYNLPLENVDVTTPTTQSTTGSSPTSPTSPPSPQSIAIGSDAAPYQNLTIKFSTTGTYDSFTQFMTALQSSLRVVDMVSLNLSQNSAKTGGTPTYQYDVVLRTYWLNSSPSQ